MNECYLVEGRELCAECARAEVERRQNDPIPEGGIVQLTDASACLRCGTDLDGQETRPLGELFVCVPCDEALRNRPFPPWLKVAAVFVLGMVIVSFIYNARFIQAKIALKSMERAMAAGDLDSGAKFAESAARHVPESPQLAQLARQFAAMIEFGAAVALLQKDGNENEAIERIKAIRGDLPAGYQTQAQVFCVAAEGSLAFDRKDYDDFLKKAEEMVKLEPNSARTEGARASALAAKYAATGDESFKAKALESFKRCEQLDGGKITSLGDFPTRFSHRLATREILSREEFQKRYPQGWKEPEKDGAKP